MRISHDWTFLVRRALTCVVLLGATGCECGASDTEGRDREEPSTPIEGGSIPMGTIEGVIRLAPDSELPRYATHPMESEGSTPIPEECPPPRTADREPLRMSDDRGLSNVPVMGLGDSARWPARGTPRTIDVHIRDCRLDPPVVVATAGDVLQVHNDLMYPFFPALGAGGFFQAVLPGEARVFELDAARPVTLQCAMTSPCGRTEIMVLGSPVHALSGEGGTFTLEVPADQDVELVAWHPIIAEASTHVVVGAGETTRVEIVVRAASPEPEPEPLPIPEGERTEDHPELGPF